MNNRFNLKYIFIFCMVATIFACQNNTPTTEKLDDSLIPIETVNNPRSATNANPDLTSLGSLTFIDSTHDFGKLKAGDVVEYEFEYTNSGKSDLLIAEARSSCGCTSPDFKREPIKPNEKGMLKVKFNSEGKSGMIDKTVTIITNGNPGEKILHITAEVN